MNTCVSDDQLIVNIQGLRHVTWGENTYVGPSTLGKHFHLTLTYKGSHQPFYYRTETEARTMFNKIREAMDKTYAKKSTS